MPINALRSKINTEAKANPAARNIGLTVPGLIVIKKLILKRKTYIVATTRTTIGVDLNIEGFEYKEVNELIDFIILGLLLMSTTQN
jgi:hypothetical protein